MQLTSGSARTRLTVVIANATNATTQKLTESLGAGEEEGCIAAVRGIWAKNCEGLTQEQQGRLWELLLEFKAEGCGGFLPQL